MSMSMTKGSPLKLMLQFALPLLMGNLLQQTYNIIDAAIVGQILGADALASVGSSSSVQFLVLGFCIGCCAGFGVPVARYFGAGDHRTMRNYIFNGAVLTAIIAAILMIACSLSCGQILHLLSVPDDIFGNAYVYLIVIFIGIPFTLLYNYLSSILRSVGDSRTPFLFLGFSAVLNIFLDLFCIIVLKWGCMGAAIATITAQAISGILCFFYIRGKMQLLRPEKENMIMQRMLSGNFWAWDFRWDFSSRSQQSEVWSCRRRTMDLEVFMFLLLQRVCVLSSSFCVHLMRLERPLLFSVVRIWVHVSRSESKKVHSRQRSQDAFTDLLQDWFLFSSEDRFP